MKRIKIMLTAIAVLAVVGGALAFKAKKLLTPNVFCATTFVEDKFFCTNIATLVTTQNNSPKEDPCPEIEGVDATITSYFTTVAGGGECTPINPQAYQNVNN